MYPKTLPKHDIYLYENNNCFYGPLNYTRGFVEKNFIRHMHEQEFYEINIVVKGTGMHYIMENKVLCQVGDVFIIPPFVTHGYYGDEGFDVYHLLLSNEFMDRYRDDLRQIPGFFTLFSAEPLMRSNVKSALHLTLNPRQMSHANFFLNAMCDLTDYGNPYECTTAAHTTILFIIYLCEIYTGKLSSPVAATKDNSFMSTISYIHEHYSERISLSDLVRLSQMSRTSYVNKFKKICKMPPLAYLTATRLDAAEKLLCETDLPVSEIAYRTGFYDASHLTRSFNSAKSLSPIAYRKQKRGY
jgi:AraC-like DNA-binding protein